MQHCAVAREHRRAVEYAAANAQPSPPEVIICVQGWLLGCLHTVQTMDVVLDLEDRKTGHYTAKIHARDCKPV